MAKLSERIKGFILSPAKAFKAEKKTSLGEAFKYGFIGLLVLGALSALMSLILPTSQMSDLVSPGIGALLSFCIIVFAGFIGMIFQGLWLHLWAYVFGARQGWRQTIKLVFYSETPSFYLGWIPLLNIVAGFWTWILGGVGLMQLQKLSLGKAVGTIIVAVVIPSIIILALIVWVLQTIPIESILGATI